MEPNSLQIFLNKNRCINNFTHTSMGTPKGKYKIKCRDRVKFYDLYYKHVFENNLPAYLTESIKDCDYTPLRINIDLNYYNKNPIRVYTREDIDKICLLYMNKIEEYLEELEDFERTFYILEKPLPTYEVDNIGNTKKNKLLVKDGFHIIAPNIIINNYLHIKFRDFACKNCPDFLDRYSFSNSYDNIFDRRVIFGRHWQMYGSTKPEKSPYLVTRAIRVFKDRVEYIEKIPDNKDLIQLLSVRNKTEYSMLKTGVEEEVFNCQKKKY